MDLIDIALTREQFEDFDADVVAALCEATQSDLREWSQRLLLAWESDDREGLHRARHALKGVCGYYGADVLMALTEAPLDDPAAKARLATCVEETIAAIRAVVSS